MPIQFRKTPVTLQEKIDKAIDITYHIKDPGDADFLRKFLIELMEKAFLKLREERHGDSLALNPLTPDELTISNKIDQLKQTGA